MVNKKNTSPLQSHLNRYGFEEKEELLLPQIKEVNVKKVQFINDATAIDTDGSARETKANFSPKISP